MKNILARLSMIFLAMSSASSCTGAQNSLEYMKTAPLDTSTVCRLDVLRYMGKWYEIARYENRFERGLSHVSATYTMDDDGKIRILNEGFRNGKR